LLEEFFYEYILAILLHQLRIFLQDDLLASALLIAAGKYVTFSSSAFEKDDTSATYPYGAMNFIPALAIHFRVANSCMKWCGIFTGLSQDGDRRIFLKTYAPLYLIKAFQMNLISAISISLDRTFKAGSPTLKTYIS
jgi:hypothetical protein